MSDMANETPPNLCPYCCSNLSGEADEITALRARLEAGTASYEKQIASLLNQIENMATQRAANVERAEAAERRATEAEQERAKLRDGVGAQLSQDATLATINLDLRAKLETAERARLEAEAACAVMREALEWYQDQMCEGFCSEWPKDFTPPELLDGDCAGCKSRTALSILPATARLTADVVAKARARRWALNGLDYVEAVRAEDAAIDALDAARVAKP